MGRVVCAWCREVLEEDRPGLVGTSHGICERCRDKLLEELPPDDDDDHDEEPAYDEPYDPAGWDWDDD